MRIIEYLYLISALILAIYGYNALVLAWLRLTRYKPFQIKEVSDDHDWPYVTVQLPVFNERYVVQRLIGAVVNINYPRDRLQIQVLDDSTDQTSDIIAQAVKEYQELGLDIEHIQRPDRAGYKGGALAYGLSSAKGDFIAIFDADFLPQSEYLKQVMPYFSDSPRIGCLQARWGHVNRETSWLTKAQANGIAGHFIVEQEVRSQKGLFLNFNGTAGVWRKACILDAGGWHHNTLTEDLDLSYRAQLKGWQILYLPDVIVPAELPIHISAFKQQQFRWAKGSIQTAKKLMGDLWRSSNSKIVKIAATIHLTHYLVHPLMLFNLLISLPLIYFRSPLLWMLPLYLSAAIGPLLMYWVAMGEEGQSIFRRIPNLLMLVLLGMGLSLNNSLAVFEALFGIKSAFLRTPKFNIRKKNTTIKKNDYFLALEPFFWVELVITIYTTGLLVYVLEQGIWSLVFWLFLYASGYVIITGLNIKQTLLESA